VARISVWKSQHAVAGASFAAVFLAKLVKGPPYQDRGGGLSEDWRRDGPV
jgi:hypothetical protein